MLIERYSLRLRNGNGSGEGALIHILMQSPAPQQKSICNLYLLVSSVQE